MVTSFLILGSGKDAGAPRVGRVASVAPERNASSVRIIATCSSRDELRGRNSDLVFTAGLTVTHDGFVGSDGS